MQLHDIHIDDERLAEFCRQNGVRELSFFGSIVRGTFGPQSDVDLYIELQPGAAPSLLDLARIQDELTTMFGRQVHLHTPAMLPAKYASYFLRGAVRAYAA